METNNKSAANYIETVYGTRPFARSLVTQDTESLMDLMNDISDYNVRQAKIEVLGELYERIIISKKDATELIIELNREINHS